MTIQLSLDAIENAAAMANIPTTLRDLHAMLEGKMTRTKPVNDLLAKLLSGQHVNPPKDEPLRAAGAGRKPNEPKPRPIVQAHREAQLSRRPLTHFIQPVLDILKDCDKSGADIASELKKPHSTTQHILRKMQDLGFLESQLVRKGRRHYFIAGHASPEIEAFKQAYIARNEARSNHQKYYESVTCEQCSTTKRFTTSDKCVECNHIYGLVKYHKMVEDK
jgi:hypothetical protein